MNAECPLEQKIGATLAWTVVYTDDAGAPVNLTGYAITMQIRDNKNSVLADLAIGSGITIVDAAAGKYSVVVSAADQAAWVPTIAKYDIRYTNGSVADITETEQIRLIGAVTPP